MLKFPLEAGDRKITLLCTSLLFAVTSAFIILKAARDALFLSDYSASTLPYFMAITTVITAGLAALYLRLYKAVSLEPAVEMSLKVFATGTLLLWGGGKLEWPYATPLLYIWTGVFGAMAPVQCWSVITQQLLTRQAKKNMGFIGAGGILGASAGGFFAKWVVQTSSVSTLLPTATMLMLAALFIIQALSVLSWKTAFTPQPDAEQPKVNSRFVALVVIVVGIGTIVATFADFQFKVVAQREMFTDVQLAAFFGSFYAYAGLATFVFQLFVTPFLMKHTGVSAGLAFLPLGMAIGNGFILGGASLTSAITLKGSEQLFKHSIDRSSLEVLYMAIPDNVKIRLKSLIDTVGVRTAEAVGAGLLILLFSVAKVPFPFLAILSLILLGISLICTVLLGREYPKALKNAIQHKEVNFSSVKTNFFTTDFYNVLPELLQKSNKETMLDLLRLLTATGNKKIRNYLEPLLEHSDAEVRHMALQMLFAQDADVSSKVEPLVSDPDPRIRVEAIRYLCFRSAIDPLAKLAHLLTDPDPTVQAAACACSLNLEKTPAQEDAFRRLDSLMTDSMSSSRLEVRLEVARILKHVRSSPSSNELFRRLLNDPSAEVRKATLRSIAELKPAGVIADVIPLLDDKMVRTEARMAISGYGRLITTELQTLMEDHERSMESKKMALRILADINPPPVELLMKYALGSNLALRFAAIKALNRIRKRQPIALPKSELDSLLDQEIAALDVEFQRVRFYAPKPGGLMQRVLQQRQQWSRERIFRVLGLQYDPKGIYNAYRALSGVDRRKADSALEYLDTILQPEHRSRILDLLESTYSTASKELDTGIRKAVLFGYLGARDELPSAAILADLTDHELSAWRSELTEALKVFPDLSLVEETLEWRYQTMENSNIIRKLSTIQKLEKLSKVDMFAELGPNELLLLANQAVEEEFRTAERIFNEGDAAVDLYVLIEGTVELLKSYDSVATLKPGNSFGTLSVLGDQPRMFSARAVTGAQCLKLDRDSFWEILDDYPSICRGVFKVIAVRMNGIMNQTARAGL